MIVNRTKLVFKYSVKAEAGGHPGDSLKWVYL